MQSKLLRIKRKINNIIVFSQHNVVNAQVLVGIVIKLLIHVFHVKVVNFFINFLV